MNAIDMKKLNLEACQTQAAAYHEQGFNCAQAVACSLAPALGFDANTAFRLLEAFGAGMGGMTETCGALSGAVAILGLLNSEGTGNPTTKGRSYKLSREAAARFRDKNTTTICRELKGIGSETGPIRSCPGCIDDAVEIVIQIIKEQQA